MLAASRFHIPYSMLRDVLNTIVFITKTQFVIKHTTHSTTNMPAGVEYALCMRYTCFACGLSVDSYDQPYGVVRLLLPLKWGTIMINQPPERGRKICDCSLRLRVYILPASRRLDEVVIHLEGKHTSVQRTATPSTSPSGRTGCH
jgi:hypothetical protein